MPNKNTVVLCSVIGGVLLVSGCASRKPPIQVNQPGVTIRTYDGLVSSTVGFEDARAKAIANCKKDRGKSNAKLVLALKSKGPPPFTQYNYNCI